MDRLRRQARERGEEWHDVGQPLTLECGATVTLIFHAFDGDPRQELKVGDNSMSPENAMSLAEEIFGSAPDDVLVGTPGLYVFVKRGRNETDPVPEP